MANGIIILPLKIATVPSGGSGNAPAAAILLESGSGVGTNTPTVAVDAWAFDDATDEHILFGFIMPANRFGGGQVRLKFQMASATTGGVVWKAGLAAIEDGVTNFTTLAFGVSTVTSAVPGTVGKEIEAIVTGLTGSAGWRQMLFIGRDADNGSDTATGDAYLTAANYEYTLN